MAFSPHLWMLFVGRAIAGLTSANISVATAYITDITPEDQRAKRFGLFNAMFGIGFIIGPVLGGLLGDTWVRLPFIAAAALNLANLLIALFVLPESHKPTHRRIDLAGLNPLKPLRWVMTMRRLIPVMLVYFILSASGEAYGTCWALWGGDTFQWNGFWIGLSLGTYGVCQAVMQSLLPGPVSRLLGERWAVVAGIACACLALVTVAFVTEGWAVFALMPLFALGGVGLPAFQALATRLVEPARQGQLQGVLASATSLATIVGPLLFSSIYAAVQSSWPGAIWLAVAVVEAAAVPLVILGTRRRPAAVG
jgi:DHA1 family tetracycline resistance protein-like MFS transporter